MRRRKLAACLMMISLSGCAAVPAVPTTPADSAGCRFAAAWWARMPTEPLAAGDVAVLRWLYAGEAGFAVACPGLAFDAEPVDWGN